MLYAIKIMAPNNPAQVWLMNAHTAADALVQGQLRIGSLGIILGLRPVIHENELPPGINTAQQDTFGFICRLD